VTAEPTEPSPHSTYMERVNAADYLLAAALAALTRKQDAGQITVRQAADERVRLLEQHMATVQGLRHDLLGGE
jgi:hypothetical protein